MPTLIKYFIFFNPFFLILWGSIICLRLNTLYTMQKDNNNNNSEIFVKCTPLTYNRAWHAVQNSDTNYTHTEMPQVETDDNNGLHVIQITRISTAGYFSSSSGSSRFMNHITILIRSRSLHQNQTCPRSFEAFIYTCSIICQNCF